MHHAGRSKRKVTPGKYCKTRWYAKAGEEGLDYYYPPLLQCFRTPLPAHATLQRGTLVLASPWNVVVKPRCEPPAENFEECLVINPRCQRDLIACQVTLLTFEDRQLLPACFASLLSGSTNRHSPSARTTRQVSSQELVSCRVAALTLHDGQPKQLGRHHAHARQVSAYPSAKLLDARFGLKNIPRHKSGANQ